MNIIKAFIIRNYRFNKPINKSYILFGIVFAIGFAKFLNDKNQKKKNSEILKNNDQKNEQNNDQHNDQNNDQHNETVNENKIQKIIKPQVQLQDIKKSQLLDQIYDQTLRARDVPEEFKSFISDEKQLDFLLDEYGMNNEKIQEQLTNHLKGMRRARGDGNCFYTSFGFQYLRYIFIKSSDQQFEDFIKMVQQLPFSVIHSDQMYEQNEEMNQIFIDYCQYIRAIDLESREQEFIKLFSNPEGQFYGLCIIFLRNIIYKLCLEDEETKMVFEVIEMNLQQQILTWEFDCENNQSIINLLSRKLLIDIILYYVDEDARVLKVQEYKNENEQILLQVNLLFRPGHYNVAIPNH
ncbi:unnamed protein product [Paramecium pentaurelia]|uniref:OTU domain-containing protein n=1 Tax=Paramecium pentaurelia TaxID=43138 RepID=A0A8S1TE33_9CILI|nr:unnamed protein product [Paramecium pentaurelia]